MKASEEKKKRMREYAKAHREQYNEYQRRYIQRLKAEGITPESKFVPYKKRVDAAIEYIEKERHYIRNHIIIKSEELLKILRGEDHV